MVHLDICGAAYDPKALAKAPGSSGGDDALVPLQTFVTPEYEMIPNSDENMRHKLVMKAFTSERSYNPQGPKNQRTRVVLQPKSVRHFRCYHKDDTSSIEVTPLSTFLERRHELINNMIAKIGEIVQSIRSNVILQLPVGSAVIVCNIKSNPGLSGRAGTICKSSEKDEVPSDRVPVLINGKKAAVALKPACVQLPVVKKRQYMTLKEKISECEKSLEESEEIEDAKVKSFSQKERSGINNAMNDPAVIKALSVIQTGQMTFTSFGDGEFKRGVEKFLRPPLDAVLPKSLSETMRNGYELSNHPRAGDAIKLINMMKAGKQRLMEEHPEAVRGDGGISVPPGSEMMRIQMSVVRRIRGDEGLAFVFQRLEELGLYVNPAK